jgi:hypothetical protein
LGTVWDESGVPKKQKQQLIPLLSQLKQAVIAQVLAILRAHRLNLASVSWREVESDANLHTYSEISGRTVNLAIKRKQHYNWAWLKSNYAADGVGVSVNPKGKSARAFDKRQPLRSLLFNLASP